MKENGSWTRTKKTRVGVRLGILREPFPTSTVMAMVISRIILIRMRILGRQGRRVVGGLQLRREVR